MLGLAERLPALAPEDRFTYFSASFRERYPARDWGPNVRLVDRRIPVRGLNAAWNRLGWPPIDRLVDRSLDLVHSPTPLLIPCKRGRRIVTLHDLFFLKHPELVEGETRRDFVTLVRDHVKRADGVICVSEYTASEARRLLDVPTRRSPSRPTASTRSSDRSRTRSRSTRRCAGCACRGAASCTSAARRSARTW